MNYTIKNNLLEVEVSSHGAELQKVIYNNTSYLHDGVIGWSRRAPLLWPNIGCIKDGYSLFDGVKYPMQKHGFLRDMEAINVSQNADSIDFTFKSDENTIKIYPFEFEVTVKYALYNNTVNSKITIKNLSPVMMPFNLGLHPAFRVPLYENEKFEEYHFIFNKQGTYEMPVVDLKEGTIDYTKRTRTFTNLKELPLSYTDYDGDALIFENIISKEIILEHQTNHHGVRFNFEDFPTLGIWTPRPNVKAPFICIEPWMGCGDAPDTNHDFTTKRDIEFVNSKESKTYSYSLTFF